MSDPNTCIAGSKTIADWRTFRTKLIPGSDKRLWQEAGQEYFRQRLSTRYLETHPCNPRARHTSGRGILNRRHPVHAHRVP